MDVQIRWFCDPADYPFNQTANKTACEKILCIPPKNIALSVVPAILSVLTILGNGFIISAILTNRKLGEKTGSILILNLSLSDLLVGLVVMPLAVVQIMTQGYWLFDKLLCRIWVSLDVICCTASIVNLCFISIDRFIGVMRPLRYQTLVTRERLLIGAAGIWVFSVTVLLATINYNPSKKVANSVCHVKNEQKYIVYAFMLSFFFPLVIVLFMYCKIYSITRKREKGLLQGMLYGSEKLGIGNVTPKKSVQNCEDPAGNPLITQTNYTDLLFPGLRIHYGGKNTSIENRRKFYQKHKKSAKTLGLVVGAFLICWLPFFFLYLLDYLHSDWVSATVFDVFTWLGYSNSAINPIIYTATWKTFRQTFYDMVHRNFCRASNDFDADKISCFERLSAGLRAVCCANPRHLRKQRRADRARLECERENSSDTLRDSNCGSQINLNSLIIANDYGATASEQEDLQPVDPTQGEGSSKGDVISPGTTTVEISKLGSWMDMKLYTTLIDSTVTEL